MSVLTDSIYDAHKVLAGLPLSQARIDGRPSLTRGVRIGLDIGDINCVEDVTSHQCSEKATTIRFARNTIVIRLRGIEGVDVAVVEVAREVDAKIRTEAGDMKAQLEALLPAISEFSVKQHTIPRLSTAPVSLSATIPWGFRSSFCSMGISAASRGMRP